jgi:hypothetical protein
MGLLRDAIGHALGADEVKNGFNAPKLPFRNNGQGMKREEYSANQSLSAFHHGQPRPDSGYYNQDTLHPQNRLQRPTSGSSQWTDDGNYQDCRGTYSPDYQGNFVPRGGINMNPQSRESQMSPPPYFETPRRYLDTYSPSSTSPRRPRTPEKEIRRGNEHAGNNWPRYNVAQSYDNNQQLQQNELNRLGALRSSPSRHADYFRPVALPQITYGDGQPFLRGYSDDLSQYGIDKSRFMNVLDAVNVAIVPNPEAQIGQKAANIAGFFL